MLAGEDLTEKVGGRRPPGEGLPEKAGGRRSLEEGLPKKVPDEGSGRRPDDCSVQRLHGEGSMMEAPRRRLCDKGCNVREGRVNDS